MASEGIGATWLEHFRRYGLRNAAVDAVFDENNCIGSYFSFHLLPTIDQEMLTRNFLVLTPLLHTTLTRVIATLQQRSSELSDAFSQMTEREREITTWIGKGKGNADIALLTGLSENTVKHYLTRLLSKTGCANRAGLAAIVVNQVHSSFGTGTKVL